MRAYPQAGDPALAGLALPVPAWRGPLAAALRRLLAAPPRGAGCFRRSLAHAAAYGPTLAAIARPDARVRTQSVVSEFPLPVTVLSLRADLSPISRTLAWLLLELHLQRDDSRLVHRLAETLRGLMAPRVQSPLELTLSECDGLAHLEWKMAALVQGRADGTATGHRRFDSLWTDQLHGVVRRLMAATSQDEDGVDGSPDETPSLNSSEVLLPAVLTLPADAEPDDAPFFIPTSTGSTDTEQSGDGRSALAWTAELYRRSSPALFRDPEVIFPRALVRPEWAHQLDMASRAFHDRDVAALEACVLHLLAIEAGLTDREAMTAAFGRNALHGIVVLDIRCRVLRRPEMRPPSAFNPDVCRQDLWHGTGGDILFPLSRQTIRAALKLIRLRKASSADPSADVESMPPPSPLLAQSASGRQVTAAIRATRRQVGATASAYRLRLAAGIAGKLGPDAAQMAFGDSFGLSSAPAYYAAFQVSQIARCVFDQNQSITGESAASSRWGLAGAHWIGSRARPKGSPIADAWRAMGYTPPSGRGRPSTRDALERWHRARDALAVHFALATSHRPNTALGEVRIGDFVPSSALVVISDKPVNPAHLTRVACTGWRFIGALENYLTAVRRIARDPGMGAARRLAARILTGEAGIFEAPNEQGECCDLDVMALFARLPEPWSTRPNLHRHMLAQALIAAGEDPEIRYFQLGWQVSDVHAASDVAHRTALDLCRRMAPRIDDWLIRQGWEGGQEPRDILSDLAGMVMPDWTTAVEAHQSDFERKTKQLRDHLQQRRRELTPSVQDRLCAAVEETMPDLKTIRRNGRPFLARRQGDVQNGYRVISQAEVDVLLRTFGKPLDSYVARVELRRMVKEAIKRGWCRGPLPAVPSLSPALSPSPFLQGLGIAVAHANRLREKIVDAVGSIARQPQGKRAARLAALSVWAICAHTPQRSLSDAVRIASAAPRAVKGVRAWWILRVPFGDGHVLLSGIPALVIQRTLDHDGGAAALANVGSEGLRAFGSLVKKLLPDATEALNAEAAASRMEASLMVAGEVELAGPARLLMRGVVHPGTVSAIRAASAHDNVTIEGATGEDAPADADKAPMGTELGATSKDELGGAGAGRRQRGTVRRITTFFHPDYDGEIDGVRALPPAQRARQLLPLLKDAMRQLGTEPTLERVLIEYSHHLLTRGGPRSAGGQRLSTIHSMFHRVSPSLVAIKEDRPLPSLGPEELTGILMASIRRSRRANRRQVLSEVRRFLQYVTSLYPVDEPDWDLLYRAAGDVLMASDPAVVTDAEAMRILDELKSDAISAGEGTLDPVERRIRELRFVAAAFSEASGARPRSIHGLTLSDVHLFEGEGYLYLRPRGVYASVKTSTSAGFIPLEGECWAQHGPWVRAWLERVRQGIPGVPQEHVPLFQMPGEALGVRYRISDVYAHVGALVRWSTGQAGRVYWLRKRRVAARHARLIVTGDVRASDVVRTMQVSGHAGILTPIASYLGDPLTYAPPDLGGESLSDLTIMSRLTGLSIAAVRQRWKRMGTRGEIGMPERLQCLVARRKDPWRNYRLPAPPRPVPYRRAFSWSTVGRALAAMAGGVEPDRIEAATGVTDLQVDRLRSLCDELMVRTGLSVARPGAVIHPPRHSPVSQRLTRMIAEENPRLAAIAEDWVSVARSAPQGTGFPLVSQAAVEALSDVFASLALDVRQVSRDGAPVIYHATQYGGWTAISWALVVAWIGVRMQQFLGEGCT